MNAMRRAYWWCCGTLAAGLGVLVAAVIRLVSGEA